MFGDLLTVVREATAPPETGPEPPNAAGNAEPINVVAERAGRLVLKTLAAAGGLD